MKIIFLITALLIGCTSSKQEEAKQKKPTETKEEKEPEVEIKFELLPENKNPVQVDLVTSGDMKLLIDIFDSESISKRHYDHVNPLDGITMGLGHWPQSQVGEFYEYLEQDDAAFKAVKYWSEKLGLWKNGADDLFDKKYMLKYTKNCRITCKDGQPNFYSENPKAVKAMRTFLRDVNVVKFQVRYYEDYLLVPSRIEVAKSGITTNQDIHVVGFASARSSASSWGRYLGGASQRGYIETRGIRWDWNKHPLIKNPTEAELDDWRMVARWQWYCAKKGKVRNRSYEYWKRFIEPKWNVYGLSKTDKYKSRKDENVWKKLPTMK